MRKIAALFFLLVSTSSLTAMVRAGVEVPAGGYYDGYYYDGNYPYYYYNNYWYGPGWYWGVYINNEGDYWGYRRRGWGYGPRHWHGRGYYYNNQGKRHH